MCAIALDNSVALASHLHDAVSHLDDYMTDYDAVAIGNVVVLALSYMQCNVALPSAYDDLKKIAGAFRVFTTGWARRIPVGGLTSDLSHILAAATTFQAEWHRFNHGDAVCAAGSAFRAPSPTE